MAVNFDKVAKRVYQILKSRGHSIEMFKDNGERAFDPEKEARRFFVKDQGIMVSVKEAGDKSEIHLYINDTNDLDTVQALIQNCNQAAAYFGILSNVEKFGKSLTPKDFSFLAYKSKKEEEEMNETVEILEAKDVSRLKGSSLSSSQRIGKPTKIIVRHNKPVDESKFAARSRHIDKIFVETHEGERLKFPVNYLQGARAMARHMSEGGEWSDPMGSHIKNMCVEMKNLKEFVKAESKNINEGTADITETVKDRISTIALEAKRLQGPLSYRRMSEAFVEDTPLSEESMGSEISRLQDMFGNSSSDILESVARLTFKEAVIDEEEEIEEEIEVVDEETGQALSVLDEFIEWTRQYNISEDDETDPDEELAQDIVTDPGLSGDIKDDPMLLNKYAKK